MEDTRTHITTKAGQPYSVRKNRDRFFYPNEWMTFVSHAKKNQRITFETLMNTGARINEARHIRPEDVDYVRNTIILRVTKVKARKKEHNPRPRTISISSQFAKILKKHFAQLEKNKEERLRHKFKVIKSLNIPLVKKKQYWQAYKERQNYLNILSTPAANLSMKNILKKMKVTDWYQFSIHNIRKSHGNWLKALGVDGAEICLRLGHDYNTFIKSYGSPDIFTYKDLQDIRIILGDLYSNYRVGYLRA